MVCNQMPDSLVIESGLNVVDIELFEEINDVEFYGLDDDDDDDGDHFSPHVSSLSLMDYIEFVKTDRNALYEALSKCQMCDIEILYPHSKIISHVAETAEDRSASRALCSIIIHLYDTYSPKFYVKHDFRCAIYLGRYDMFIESVDRYPNLINEIINDPYQFYYLAFKGGNQSILDFLTDTVEIDDRDYTYEKCFWAAYHDDRETWLTEAKKLISNGQTPHLYSWVDYEIDYGTMFNRPHFVADIWYFNQMLYELRCKTYIGYYYGYAIEFKIDWMCDFLEKYFEREYLIRPEDLSYEYVATWNGHGFDVEYIDNDLGYKIYNIHFTVDHTILSDEEQVLFTNELAELNEKKRLIELEKSFTIEVNDSHS